MRYRIVLAPLVIATWMLANHPANALAAEDPKPTQSTPQSASATGSPAPAQVDLAKTKYQLTKVAPVGSWTSGDLRYAVLSNTGRVAVSSPTKIPVSVDVAAPLFEDNPFTRPQRGLPKDPHLMRDRIVLWEKSQEAKSITLPGGDPKSAWKTVCLSPNGRYLVANETRSLGSRSAYRWDGKKWEELPRPRNHEVVFYGVNDSGLMVGTSDAGDARNGCEAVVFRDGRVQTLPSPANKAVAWAVSNSGLIAGQALSKDGTAQACLWKNNQPVLLGTLGGKTSVAHAVNDSGTVVGLSLTASKEEAAFIWQNGQMRPVMDASKTCSIAYGLNNAGVIVGLTYRPERYGFIASGDQVLNLNDLLLESPSWEVTNAIAVNDQNWVLAVAENRSQEYVVLLTPSN